MNLQRLLSLFCSGALALQLTAAEPADGRNTGNTTSVSAAPAISASEIQELRRKISEQQKQIQQLQKSIAAQQELLERTVQAVAASGTGGTVAAAPAALVPVGNSGSSPVQPMSLVPTATRASQAAAENKSPLSFKIGVADFTPFGFVDATAFWRSTNTGSGIGTGFGSIPFGNSVPGNISETNFTAQNSRVGLRVDSNVLGAKVLGYIEADFLGFQPANIFVTSNADTFRMRNFFVDINKGKYEVMGGQDWSMLVPGRRGLSPIPSDLFYTQNMDTNYQVGLTWTRQAQFRFVYHPNEKFAAGLSLENPEQYVGASGVTYPASIASNSNITGQFNDGTTNYRVPNLHPDIIVKATYDTKPKGLQQHIEVAGLLRSFRYYNPLLDDRPTATGGGGAVNANFEVAKNLHIVTNNFFSSGGGRYIFGLGPDLIVKPNGDLSLVHAYSTVDGIEANLTKNLLLYTYYGGAYYGKNTGVDTNGKLIGYGFSGSPNSSNRTIQEYTFGLVPTVWRNPQWGALQIITQYSYVFRNPWYVAAGTPKNAKTNMVYVNLRYTLP
jgi:hypothetical protein